MKLFIKIIAFLYIISIKSGSFDQYPDLYRKFKTNIICPLCLGEGDNLLFVETNCQNNKAHHTFHAQCLKEMFVNFKINLCPICQWDLVKTNEEKMRQYIQVVAISYRNLIIICSQGNLKALHRFLSYGLDINCQEESIKVFSNEPHPNYIDTYKYLFSIQKCTPLIVAAAFNQWHIVKHLLQFGVNIAQIQGYKCLDMAIVEQKVEIIELIVSQKVMNLNRKSNKGNTFLINAVKIGNIDIIKLLLDYGANINLAAEQSGDTPYILATKNKQIDIAKYLFEHGADISIKNKDGKNALDIATELN